MYKEYAQYTRMSLKINNLYFLESFRIFSDVRKHKPFLYQQHHNLNTKQQHTGDKNNNIRSTHPSKTTALGGKTASTPT